MDAPEDNVTPFRRPANRNVAGPPAVNAEVVATLEAVLEMARSGEVTSIALVTAQGGKFATCYDVATGDHLTVIAGVHLLAGEIGEIMQGDDVD